MNDWNYKSPGSEELGAVLIALEASPKGYDIDSLFCIITPVHAVPEVNVNRVIFFKMIRISK